jgi:hypothetical protein
MHHAVGAPPDSRLTCEIADTTHWLLASFVVMGPRSARLIAEILPWLEA